MSYSALLYMLLSGIFGALILVLLVAFLVTIVCLICIHHRKRRIGNKCIGIHVLIIINSKCSLLASFPSPLQLQAEQFFQWYNLNDKLGLGTIVQFVRLPIGISLDILTRSLCVT